MRPEAALNAPWCTFAEVPLSFLVLQSGCRSKSLGRWECRTPDPMLAGMSLVCLLAG
jgi:hypothetical protein